MPSCDMRANERPKKIAWEGEKIQTQPAGYGQIFRLLDRIGHFGDLVKKHVVVKHQLIVKLCLV